MTTRKHGLPTHDNASLVAWLRSHGLGVGCGPGVAVSAFRADLTALLAQASAGRREYAGNAPEATRSVLESEAATLDAVTRLVAGDMAPMRSWLPSWRWDEDPRAR